MRVVIIGAGAAGLCSARYVSASGHECDVLELGPKLGGTWVYTDEVGKDKYGYPLYNAMYKDLRTNLPKEVMSFPDFPILVEDRSYLTQTEILQFLNSYTDHFNVRPLIKFNRMVTKVYPLEDNTWEVTSVDKPTHKEIVNIYDAVMICNGHYNLPFMPTLEGQEKFKGIIDHSHNYRTPEKFQGQRVLVIGAGSSGLDLALHFSKVAEQVVLSHHRKAADQTEYPPNVTKKPDVKQILDSEQVEFVDGSCQSFDVIYFCTGYRYSFPFLDESCGITIDENCIQPLYKHMININRPTMCFIGIPSNACAFQMSDLQARFYTKYLDGVMPLPSADEMRSDTEEDMRRRRAMGLSKKQSHAMGLLQLEYFKELAEKANTTPIAPVVVLLREECLKKRYSHLMSFRQEKYKIIDNENFIMVN